MSGLLCHDLFKEKIDMHFKKLGMRSTKQQHLCLSRSPIECQTQARWHLSQDSLPTRFHQEPGFPDMPLEMLNRAIGTYSMKDNYKRAGWSPYVPGTPTFQGPHVMGQSAKESTHACWGLPYNLVAWAWLSQWQAYSTVVAR